MEIDHSKDLIERWTPSVVVVVLIVAWLWMWHSRDLVAEQLGRTQSALEECQSNYEWDDPEAEEFWNLL